LETADVLLAAAEFIRLRATPVLDDLPPVVPDDSTWLDVVSLASFSAFTNVKFSELKRYIKKTDNSVNNRPSAVQYSTSWERAKF
jgi:hypothetical protein